MRAAWSGDEHTESGGIWPDDIVLSIWAQVTFRAILLPQFVREALAQDPHERIQVAEGLPKNPQNALFVDVGVQVHEHVPTAVQMCPASTINLRAWVGAPKDVCARESFCLIWRSNGGMPFES